MGGTSTTSQTQNSTTNPYAPAVPAINGLLGNLSGQIGSAGLNTAQTGAINQLDANAANGNPYASSIGGVTTNLLAGGGATNQAGAVNQNYQNYYNATNPLASNTNYDPASTPGLSTALSGMTNNILTSVNGSAAAAGRDGSPANSTAAAYGLAQGLAPIITGQYNQNVNNQQSAASNLYNAGNTNAGILSGLQQQGLTNQQAGANLAPTALDANNYGANATLAAEAQRQGIPLSQLGMLAQIGVPLASLGSTSTGQSQGTQQMSGAQQYNMLASGTGNLLKGLFG